MKKCFCPKCQKDQWYYTIDLPEHIAMCSYCGTEVDDKDLESKEINSGEENAVKILRSLDFKEGL